MMSYDVHPSHCAYENVVCSVFIVMLRVLYFIKNKICEHLISIKRFHENSSFRKLAVNKWICRMNCDYFLD